MFRVARCVYMRCRWVLRGIALVKYFLVGLFLHLLIFGKQLLSKITYCPFFGRASQGAPGVLLGEDKLLGYEIIVKGDKRLL